MFTCVHVVLNSLPFCTLKPWARVKNESSPISLALDLFPMPFNIYCGKAWGRDIERDGAGLILYKRQCLKHTKESAMTLQYYHTGFKHALYVKPVKCYGAFTIDVSKPLKIRASTEYFHAVNTLLYESNATPFKVY